MIINVGKCILIGFGLINFIFHSNFEVFRKKNFCPLIIQTDFEDGDPQKKK